MQQQTRRGERQTKEKTRAVCALDLAVQRGDDRGAGATARAHQQRGRREAGDLRGHLHEGGEVQVEPPVHVAEEVQPARHVAAERAERLAKPLVREVRGHAPGERRRGAGEGLADVRARPDGLRVAPFGEAAAGERTGLEKPDRGLHGGCRTLRIHGTVTGERRWPRNDRFVLNGGSLGRDFEPLEIRRG